VINFERLTENISNPMSLVPLLSLWKRRSLINTIIRSIFHRTSYLWRNFWQSEDRTLWYILIMKANEMHYFSNLFYKVLYVFRTYPLSIISSISTLYTRNRYLSF